jgi:hypothetical protein
MSPRYEGQALRTLGRSLNQCRRARMILTRIRNSFVAGLCGTAAHGLLVLVHSKTGPLPEFQPNDDIQRALSWLAGAEIHPGVAWLLLFVNGAVIWGFLFGQVYRFLPGPKCLAKGGVFCRHRLDCDGACILSPRRPRHFRYQAGLRYGAGSCDARDAAHLQCNDELGLSSSEQTFGLTQSR